MVEQLTLNQRVAGSSPARFTKLPVLSLHSKYASCGSLTASTVSLTN
jgi:hypothetical protein